jgi:ribonuclease-3
MSRRSAAPAALEDALEYQFRDPQLLRLALRHASAALAAGRHNASNERLEFLGDRVLGLCVAELLCERFEDEGVGELARRLAALVSREALERVGLAIDLPRFIEVARGGEGASTAAQPGIVADACEAVIAALYLDGGLETAVGFVRRAWQPLLAEAAAAPKDPKTALQEWAQGRGLPLPVYETIGQEGPAHRPLFVIRVSLADGREATAGGPSKRVAEAAAAKALLATCGPEGG